MAPVWPPRDGGESSCRLANPGGGLVFGNASHRAIPALARHRDYAACLGKCTGCFVTSCYRLCRGVC